MGKKDEDEHSEDVGGEGGALKKDIPHQMEALQKSASKIPNKGKSKLDQVPIKFSDEELS